MDNTPAGWFPDPTGRYELRYWDGDKWSAHVSVQGQVSADPEPITPGPQVAAQAEPLPIGTDRPERIERQVQQQAGVAPNTTGKGTILTEPVLVVNQKAKLLELTNEYAVYDQRGNQIGGVRQVGQSAARKVLRAFTSVDQFLTTRLQVCGMDGAVILELTRPAKILKSTVVVSTPGGGEVGRIVQQNVVGKINFALEGAGGRQLGAIKAENWRAWNFRIEDTTGAEVARITKTWEGLAKNMFTSADNYVVQIHGQLDEPLRSMVVASALCVDTALKQDSRGLN
jgi:uncharacterized protein YxjI